MTNKKKIRSKMSVNQCFLYILLIFNICVISGFPAEPAWGGKWFPHEPNSPDTNPTVAINKHAHLHDEKHGIVMGVKDKSCDDAETNLQIDWLDNPENYTCLEDKHHYQPNGLVTAIHNTEPIPADYHAPHACMEEKLHYETRIPTFGTHRPLWGEFGEYSFLPVQRWLHNLEHGSVVMLYHPCANGREVNKLRTLVTSCLYRHVITPYNLLTSKRPLALVTWGHSLEMSKVSEEMVINFIKDHALKGPEQTSRDGQYNYRLIKHAEVVPYSNINDTNLCPSNGQLTHM